MPKEKPLDSFVPTSYSALLEGTLLTNGDLKGSWRTRLEDPVKHNFLMVLMDRGVYDGGFNLGIPRDDPGQPAVKEIHDKWHSFQWCETTKGSSNVWGRGRNNQFGECYLIGVHDPHQRKIIMYKVEEAEMLIAQAFARTPDIIESLPIQSCPGPSLERSSTGLGQKRPRASAETGKAAVAVSKAAQNPESDNSSSSAPMDGTIKGTKGPAAIAHSLPGFSGRFDEITHEAAEASVDELADLTILGARLQREKLKIQQDARAQRQAYVDVRMDCERKLKQAKSDEKIMLSAVHELRVRMMEKEQQLEAAAKAIKKFEAEEQRALSLWNQKWETQVAPFIAQCEQGVKKKAQELERKTREAEKERYELERELERLHSVKKIGDIVPPNAPDR